MKEINRLMLVIDNPATLQNCAKSAFSRHDINKDGVLSLDELQNCVGELHKELDLHEEDTEERALVRCRMRKFDVDGSGTLDFQEFLKLYKWTLWRKYEDVNPPRFARSKKLKDMAEKKKAQ